MSQKASRKKAKSILAIYADCENQPKVSLELAAKSVQLGVSMGAKDCYGNLPNKSSNDKSTIVPTKKS